MVRSLVFNELFTFGQPNSLLVGVFRTDTHIFTYTFNICSFFIHINLHYFTFVCMWVYVYECFFVFSFILIQENWRCKCVIETVVDIYIYTYMYMHVYLRTRVRRLKHFHIQPHNETACEWCTTWHTLLGVLRIYIECLWQLLCNVGKLSVVNDWMSE